MAHLRPPPLPHVVSPLRVRLVAFGANAAAIARSERRQPMAFHLPQGNNLPQLACETAA